MHQASSLLGVAALVLALLGPGMGGIARAQDEEAASGLNDQIAALLNQVGDDPGWEERSGLRRESGDGVPTPAPKQPANPPAVLQSWSFEGDQQADSGGATMEASEASQPFAVLQPWSFAGGDQEADSAEGSPGPGTFSFDTGTADNAPAEQSSGPRDFRINDSFKVKAQPLGLGGRVTLTFTFPTGY